MNQQVVWSIAPALKLPWILDIDVTVKPLYGHQQGAELGYNPHKPGRPCHMYHSYFVANLRISLGVEVRAGKEQAPSHGLPEMWRTLERLPRENWPTFVRGDCGNGNKAVMRECESARVRGTIHAGSFQATAHGASEGTGSLHHGAMEHPRVLGAAFDSNITPLAWRKMAFRGSRRCAVAAERMNLT